MGSSRPALEVTSLAITIPWDRFLIGVTVSVQGADVLAPGGCGFGTLTDTWDVSIGG